MTKEEFKAIRIRLGYKRQADFGKFLGKNQKTIGRYERGGPIPKSIEMALAPYMENAETPTEGASTVETPADSESILKSDVIEIFESILKDIDKDPAAVKGRLRNALKSARGE